MQWLPVMVPDIIAAGFSAIKPFIYFLRTESWKEMMWQEGKCGFANTSTLYEFFPTGNVSSIGAGTVFFTDITLTSITVPLP